MRKILIFILIAGTSLLMYGFRGTGWQGDMHKRTYDTDDDGVVDSAEVTIAAGANVRDTINAWWGDTSAIYSTVVALEDSLDSVLVHINDTATVIRNNISTYIEDSLDSYLLITRHNDSIALVRGNIPDSINIAREVTATWQWDGGNIIAADGQQFIATDDAEDDSVQIYISNDSAFIVATGIPIAIGEEGLTTSDSLELELIRVVGATDTTFLLPTSVRADSLFGIIDTTEGDFTTYVGNHGSCDADTFVWVVVLDYYSGAPGVDGSLTAYKSNGANDELYSGPIPMPFSHDGDAAVIDSMWVNYYTQGVEDSIHMYVQQVDDDCTNPSLVDSVWLGVGSGWGTGNILPNGSITPTAHYCYRLFLDCINDGTDNVRISYTIRMVWHR